MMFGEVPLHEADGALLAHAVAIGGQRVSKGTRVDAALLVAAGHAGLERLWVARLEASDVAEADAAVAIGRAMAGAGVEARPPVHGRVNLHATWDGLLDLDVRAVAEANGLCDDVGIATRPPGTPVGAGDLLATVKIIPFAMARTVLDDLLAARPMLTVLPWRDRGPVLLLQTRLPDTSAKMMAKTTEVTRDRVVRFGWTMHQAEPVAHAVALLAQALAGAQARHGLILVAGATATADRRDVVPAAIEAAGGTVVRVGMPVDPGNLMVLGEFRDGAVVIGLPGCARSPKRNGLDLVLEQLAAFGGIGGDAISIMGVGGLLEESGVAVPWAWRP